MHSNKYAIIKSGGKQYRVAQNDVIEVELLDAEPGSQIEFTDVLFVCDGSSINVGKPAVSGCSIKGELIGIVAGPKVVSMKYKPSHRQYRKFGHRQHYSQVKITEIAYSKEKHHGS